MVSLLLLEYPCIAPIAMRLCGPDLQVLPSKLALGLPVLFTQSYLPTKNQGKDKEGALLTS